MDKAGDICLERHICRGCKRLTNCETYIYACPWRNDDEDDMCDECLEQHQEDMEQWYFSNTHKDKQ